MAETKRPRRRYRSKRIQARLDGDGELEGIWRSKQEAEPGTALPDGYPYRSRLAAVGYTTVHDLDGADIEEMVTAGFTEREARAIGIALEPFQPVED